MCSSDFHTQKGYELACENQLTSAMEDYLEMIARLTRSGTHTRVHLLAERLNVKASSASKMVDNLRELGLVLSEKYGHIQLTSYGNVLGEYLLHRHDLLNRLLCLINHTSDELEQTERIEHYIDERTIHNIEHFLQQYPGS